MARVHTRLGARIGPVIPYSMQITGMGNPGPGRNSRKTGGYVFPAGLSTVHIDRGNDAGEYWEPSIWIIHQIPGGS